MITKEYLEQILHESIQMEEYTTAKLPLIYRNAVKLQLMHIGAQECILIETNETMLLPELRKCYHQLERITCRQCALYLRNMTYYAKDMLLQEGIPFVWEGRQFYLPFIGIMLNPIDERKLKPCGQISFVTQKLLLKALYEGWQGISVTQAAKAMKVSKMTITRCFDEIEVLGLPLLKLKSRARKLYIGSDKRTLWEIMQPVLRNPVIRTFGFAEPVNAQLPKSGLSALAVYSMLGDEPFPTVAFEKSWMTELKVSTWKQVQVGEKPSFVAHEVGYSLPLEEYHALDPLSVTLMLTDEEKEDPRVQKSINEMLEAYVW